MIARAPLLMGFALVAAAGGAGCSDRGEPVAPAPPGPAVVSFAAHVQPAFDAHCVGCHGHPVHAGFLDLDAASSHAQLVGVNAYGYPGRQRVAPGDAAASVLWQKLADTGEAGPRMPEGGAALDTALVSLVRRWIDQGAADN